MTELHTTNVYTRQSWSLYRYTETADELQGIGYRISTIHEEFVGLKAKFDSQAI